LRAEIGVDEAGDEGEREGWTVAAEGDLEWEGRLV